MNEQRQKAARTLFNIDDQPLVLRQAVFVDEPGTHIILFVAALLDPVSGEELWRTQEKRSITAVLADAGQRLEAARA